MAQVFISYSSKDKPFVEALGKALGDVGHVAQYDQAVLTPGAHWRSTLDLSLRASDVVVSIVSNNSHTSQWVMAEFGVAQGLGIPVIPVVLDGIGIPPVFGEISAVIQPDRDVARVAAYTDVAIRSLASEAKKAVQARIGVNAATFINESVKELKERETVYRRIAYTWYLIGFSMLLLAIGFGVWRSVHLPAINDWMTIILFGIIAIVITVLLLAGSKYCFTLGKSFMVEALRNSDRKHAIKFGQFYLAAYSDEAEWKELKEAFQHWNMDKGSSFLTQDATSYDPKLLEHVVEMSKAVAGIKKNGEKE